MSGPVEAEDLAMLKGYGEGLGFRGLGFRFRVLGFGV